jgi:uncharacterized membrane protein YdjX (TVP38/TMEM64 family)
MDQFIDLIANSNFILAPFLFILVRALAIIIPPIPGTVFDIAGIKIFGPWYGFLWTEIGVMLGAVTAFLLARYFRKYLPERFLHKLDNLEQKMPKHNKALGMIVLRFLTNPFFDVISYMMGMTKISFSLFFWTSLAGTAPEIFLFYYFGGYFFDLGLAWGILFSVIFITAFFFIAKYYLRKNRNK